MTAQPTMEGCNATRVANRLTVNPRPKGAHV